MSLWLALFGAGTLHAAQPVARPMLWLALDEGPASQMLRSELSRDWRHANPDVVLTRRQQADLRVIGRRMSAVQSLILAQFAIVFVSPDRVPLPERLHLPAVRINRGRWESIDRRAFAFETRPLLTLDWYRTRYAALYDRDASRDAWNEYGCNAEGFSGPAQIETPAPWEIATDQRRGVKEE